MNKTLSIFVLLLAFLLAASLQADQLTDLLTGKPSATQETTTDKAINVDSSKQSDAKINKRLREIYNELDDLKNIGTEVNNGVVTLGGEINSAKSEETALKLAKQIDGVVAVENNMEVTRAIDQRLGSIWIKYQKLFRQAVASIPLLLIAITTFVLFWLFGGWVSNRNRLLQKIAPNRFIANLLGQVLHLVFIIIGLVLALSLLDATSLLSTILGAAGIVGLAVGFAVRDTVENYIASILLSLRNPFEVNDLVDIDGNLGNVARLTTRATILISPDGNHVRLPNSLVFKAVIVNYTRNPQRRFQFDIGVDSAQDLQDAQNLALETLNAIEGVLDEPKAQVIIEELGDFNVVLRLYGWVDQANFSFSKVRSESIRRCKRAFDQAHIVMPEPIYQIRVAGQLENQIKQQSVKAKPKSPNTVTITDNRKDDAAADLSPDNSVEIKVAEEISQDDTENLLDESVPKE
jgi:small-conductance mechanosensitive channel